MRYDLECIEITSDLKYNGDGLTISYKAATTVGRVFFSDFELLQMLLKLGYTTRVSEQGNSRGIKHFIYLSYSPIELGEYMTRNLDANMAKAFVLHYLNNRTEKPCTPPTL